MSTDFTGLPERPPRRTRWLALALVGVLAVGAGAALVVRQLGRTTPRDDASDEGSDRPSAASHVLVAVRGEGEALPALAVVADTPAGGVVVLLPATAVVEVPGTGPISLARALQETGPEGLAVSVANAVPIRVPSAIVGSASAVEAAVDAAGVTVDVPEDVVVDEGGEQRTLYSRGPTRMTGGEFVHYQTASFPGKLELDRLIRQGAGWRGLLGTLAEAGPDALRSWSGDTDRAARVIRAAGDDPTVMSLPVERLSLAGEDLYQVDDEGLGPLRRALAEFITVEDDTGRRVQLLVGVDAPVGPAAARVLVDAGYVIVLTGPASRPYEVTQVVVTANVAEGRRAGEAILDLLGGGSVGVTDRRFSVLDIMLVVGADWAEANGFSSR